MFGWFGSKQKSRRGYDEVNDPTGGEGVEFFRAWSHNNELVVKLDAEMFDQTSFAGVFLADIARHYARAFVQSGRCETEADALAKIRAAFDAEWFEPTDQVRGEILKQ